MFKYWVINQSADSPVPVFTHLCREVCWSHIPLMFSGIPVSGWNNPLRQGWTHDPGFR